MKKYFNILLLICIFSAVLVLQIGYDLVDLSAKPSSVQSHRYQYFANSLKQLKVRDLSGSEYDLGEIETPIVINFWASWCSPCMEELSWLESLRREFNHDELFVVAINIDDQESLQKIKRIVRMNDLSFPVAIDHGNLLSSRFLIDSVPTTMVFVGGKVVAVYSDISEMNEKTFIEKISRAID